MSTSRAGAIVLAFALLQSSVAIADDTFSRLENRPTFLTTQVPGMVSQPVPGFWWWRIGSATEQNLFQLSLLDGGQWLAVHTRSGARIDESIKADSRHLIGTGPAGGVLGQFKGNGKCFAGLVQTVELRYPNTPPQCPQFYWWTRTKMCFNDQRIKGNATTSGFRHDSKTCEVDRTRPTSLEAALERFSGAAFAPVIGGAYIRTVTVTAPAQFGAEVRLAWDYRTLEAQGRMPAKVILSETGSASTNVFSTDRLSGTRLHPVSRRRMHLIMRVVDRKGMELHQDHLVADLRQ